MGDLPSASIDAIASHDTAAHNAPVSTTRRSISIFSRRGTEAPENPPPFIIQAAVKGISHARVEKPAARLSRSLSLNRKPKSTADMSGKGHKSPKGTILKAVPQLKTIQMTPLEEEMATLPNEQILSSIGENSVSAYGDGAYSRPAAPSRSLSVMSKRSPSMVPRSHSTRRRDANSRIGVWVDGIVHWDQQNHRPVSKSWEKLIEEETGLAPVLSGPAKEAISGKPSLSVIIPRTKQVRSSRSHQAFHYQATAPKKVAPIAPASVLSKFAIPIHELPSSEAKEVSPVSSESSKSATPPIPPRSLSRPSSSSNTRERASHAASSTDESVSDEDDASDYSKNSSATSVDMATPPLELPPTDGRPVSGFSLADPRKAGVFDDSPNGSVDTNKPLPPIPQAMARRSMTVAPLSSSSQRPTSPQAIRSTKSVKTMPNANRLSARSVRVSRSVSQLDLCDEEFMRSSPYSLDVPEKPSPTLSQAENDLRSELSTISRPGSVSGAPTKKPSHRAKKDAAPSIKASSTSLDRSSSVHSVMHPPESAPAVPKRSRKRDWRLPPRSKGEEDEQRPPRPRSELQLSSSEPIEGLRRSASVQVAGPTPDLDEVARAPSDANGKPVNVPEVVVEDVSSDDFTDANESIHEESAHAMSATAAEDVLLHILASLTSTEDLFNTAIINKGMYRVYKENEMFLLREVTYHQSPVLWELREWSPPERKEVRSSKASSQLEHTPLTYMRCYRRDVAVIESLKKLILEKCQTAIRRETAFALSTPSHPNASRFDDAFWRIWCFCKAFGSNKGREEDITGQLDWLKGGILAHNQGCVATVNTNLDFDMSSVLLNAPDYFAIGNMDGLTSGQLYDMTEIWTCMATLLQGYLGRVDVARSFGIYDHCEVEVDEIEREEQILEEWTAYLLTLGPAVVLEMAEASDDTNAGFELAKENGWTTWAEPMYSGSRHNFLKEPVARLLQEIIAEEQDRQRDPHAAKKKEESRQRVANLAQEIRLRRQQSSYKRLPLIDMANERPMSMFSHASVRSTRSATSNVSHATALLRSPTSATESSRMISPIAEDRAETTYNPTHYNSYLPGAAQNTSEKAVHKIVDMGFTPTQARVALHATDRGDGLRVDKAIDFLLRQP